MPRAVYKNVDGYCVPQSFNDECVRSALNYEPQPGDLFIVSYPKCGTTWTQHIVYNILNDRPPPNIVADFRRKMPFLELKGAQSVRDMSRPGAIKTHMPFRSTLFSKHARYIYVCRNPYDCCVSFFYHAKNKPDHQFADGTFSEFFEMFVEGALAYGDYFDHLLPWYERRDDPNVLLLTYEGLKKDTAAWVLKIADFLGENHGTRLRADPVALNEVLARTSLETMRQMFSDGEKTSLKERLSHEERAPQRVKDAGEVTTLLRKGIVGDWRSHFSAEQVKRLKERIALETRGTNVMSLWDDCDLP
uniref:Putative sulfotransferase n=1 Tax=Ixodes ricinus TaxID=34613 RepID=V5IEL2_IXORI